MSDRRLMKQFEDCLVYNISGSAQLYQQIDHAISISGKRQTREQFVKDSIAYCCYCVAVEHDSLDLPTE